MVGPVLDAWDQITHWGRLIIQAKREDQIVTRHVLYIEYTAHGS
jgi:hypothetical protein